MSEETKREFKGIWIPKNIWVSEEISVMEKVFLAEIDSFERAKGCYASNRYFSKFFKISMTRVSQIISKLEEKGFIKTNLNLIPDTKGIKSRGIKINWKKVNS